MQMKYKEITTRIEDLDTTLSLGNNNAKTIEIDIETVFDNNETMISRNKLIKLMQNCFITDNGYVNTPALMVYCHTYNFRYSIGSTSDFCIRYGCLIISVSA